MGKKRRCTYVPDWRPVAYLGKPKDWRPGTHEEHAAHMAAKKAKKRKKGRERLAEIPTTAARLKWLIEVANSCPWVSRAAYESARDWFDRYGWKLPIGEPCAACGDTAVHRHHIRPLSRGGDSRHRNLIGLCESCHAEIHPWLEVNPSETDTVNGQHLCAIAAEAR